MLKEKNYDNKADLKMSELDEHNEAEQAALLEKGPLLILKALTFEF